MAATWQMRKLGIEKAIGTDAQMAAKIREGKITAATVVGHPQHTAGQWVPAGTIPVLNKLIKKQEQRRAKKSQETAARREEEARLAAEQVAAAPVIPVEVQEPIDTSYEVDTGYEMKTIQDEPEEVDSAFLLQHGASLETVGIVIGWAVFLFLGVLPFLYSVYIAFSSDGDKSQRALLVIGALLYTVIPGAISYYIFYSLRLIGALFRTFAHIERNTRRVFTR